MTTGTPPDMPDRSDRSSSRSRQDRPRRDLPRRDPEWEDEPGLLDEVADRLGFRHRIKANPALALLYRIGVAVLGVLVVIVGIILLPLPGPGWLVIFLGLTILATEFAWAERLLDYARAQVSAWTHWVARQPLVVKAAISLGCAAVVAAAVWLYLAWRGVPTWIPLID